jgi:hypothetical protein
MRILGRSEGATEDRRLWRADEATSVVENGGSPLLVTLENELTKLPDESDNACRANVVPEEDEMIKLDLSKVFSPRLVIYLVSVIPGLFFEAAVTIGAPETAQGILENVGKAFPFPPYALFFYFVALAFVIGHVFMLLAWFAELFLSAAYRIWRAVIRITFGSRTFYKWLAKIPRPPDKRGIFVRLYSRAVFAARMPRRYEQAQPAVKCLSLASKHLLKRRYGIDVIDSLSPMREEWYVWFSVLGKPPNNIREEVTMMRTTLGCGLAGYLALPFAPSLHTWYFLGACTVFAVTGLYMTWSHLLWRTDPVRLNLLRLQSVLLDLAEVGSAIPTKVEDDE